MPNPAMPVDPLRNTPFSTAEQTPMQPRLLTAPNSRLHETAEAVGSAVGKAENAVNKAVESVRDLPRRFTIVKGRAQEKAVPMAQDLRRHAQNRAVLLRQQARQLISQYPLQTLGGIFAASMLFGIMLRVWRVRDER